MICKKCKANLPDSFKFCPECGTQTAPKAKARRRPAGMGSVYRLSGKRAKPWAVSVSGKYLASFETRTEAEVYLVPHRSKPVDLLTMTLSDVRNRWQNTKRYQRLSRDAKNNYSAAWKRMEAFSSMRMSEIKTSHFQQAIAQAVSEGVGRDTCEKIRSLASLLCQEAMKDDIIDRNYALSLELPERVSKKKSRNFTDEEILLLFDHDQDRDVRIILCLIYTGTRQKDLFEITKDQVYLERGYMIGGSKTDAGKDRLIPIRREIAGYVSDFMKESGDYLISNKAGNKTNSSNFLKRQYYPTLERLGICYKDEAGNNILTPHRTRHTYIAGSIAGGAAPEALTKIVGHAQYETTVDKYADDLDIEYLKKEAAKGL